MSSSKLSLQSENYKSLEHAVANLLTALGAATAVYPYHVTTICIL
jgi:hypothetical protein